MSSFRETFEFTEKTKGELRQLFHPYYIVNLCLAFSFLFVKLTKPICEILFAPGPVKSLYSRMNNEFLVKYRRLVSWI